MFSFGVWNFCKNVTNWAILEQACGQLMLPAACGHCVGDPWFRCSSAPNTDQEQDDNVHFVLFFVNTVKWVLFWMEKKRTQAFKVSAASRQRQLTEIHGSSPTLTSCRAHVGPAVPENETWKSFEGHSLKAMWVDKCEATPASACFKYLALHRTVTPPGLQSCWVLRDRPSKPLRPFGSKDLERRFIWERLSPRWAGPVNKSLLLTAGVNSQASGQRQSLGG